MQSGNTKSSSRQHGFTLVELMIVAPITILVVAGILGVMVSMVGNAILSQQQNESLYELNDSLAQIEQDVRDAIEILPATNAISSPQGATNPSICTTLSGIGSGSFEDSCSLILKVYATDKNPTDTTHSLVLDGTTPKTHTIVYYRHSGDGNLYRRTILPSNASGIWQRNSCHPSQRRRWRCQTQDRLLARGVTTFVLTYYSGATSTGQTASINTTGVHIDLSTSRSAAGDTVSSSGSLRAARISN